MTKAEQFAASVQAEVEAGEPIDRKLAQEFPGFKEELIVPGRKVARNGVFLFDDKSAFDGSTYALYPSSYIFKLETQCDGDLVWFEEVFDDLLEEGTTT